MSGSYRSVTCILVCILFLLVFFFNDTATTEIYPLSLHDALPIFVMTAATGTAEETLATLVHELVHCTLPVAEDHGPTFQMRVREAGLDGDPRATVPAADFGQQYADVLSALGPLPGDTTPMV